MSIFVGIFFFLLRAFIFTIPSISPDAIEANERIICTPPKRRRYHVRTLPAHVCLYLHVLHPAYFGTQR